VQRAVGEGPGDADKDVFGHDYLPA
jgi:hypothetical protein